jgi:sec-independent protein translocase protein TatA
MGRTPRSKERANAMPFNIGPMELVVVLVIALLVLGPKKLPEVGKSLGKGMREFKDSLSNISSDDEREESKKSLNA